MNVVIAIKLLVLMAKDVNGKVKGSVAFAIVKKRLLYYVKTIMRYAIQMKYHLAKYVKNQHATTAATVVKGVQKIYARIVAVDV